MVQRMTQTNLVLVWLNGTFFSLSPAAIHFSHSLCDVAPGSQEGTCRRKGKNSTRNFPGTKPSTAPASACSDISTYTSSSSSTSMSYRIFNTTAAKLLFLCETECLANDQRRKRGTHKRIRCFRREGLLSNFSRKMWVPDCCIG